MKRTFVYSILGVALVALMSACGRTNRSANVITPTPIANTLTGTFNPNQNLFLNGCPNCNYQNPAYSCPNGIYTGTTCITNQQYPNFGQDPMIQAMYSNAVLGCQSYYGMASSYQMQMFNPYMTNYPGAFNQGCNTFSNHYPFFY